MTGVRDSISAGTRLQPARLGSIFAVLAVVVAALAATGIDTPVADAAMRGDIESIRRLLADGADVNAAHGDGMSALHWAARHGDPDMAAMLLAAGARIDADTRVGGYTPLHLAAEGGNGAVARLLVEEGADVSATTTPGGTQPIHLAAGAGDVASIEALLAGGADPDARELAAGQTPLVFAAAHDRAEAITALLAAGADPELRTNLVDLEALRELDREASQRQREALEALTGGERSPTAGELHAAVRAGRTVYDAAAKTDTGSSDDESQAATLDRRGGLTPLLHAARQGNTRAAIALLDGGADVDGTSASDDTSPLLMATINGQFDLAVLLAERGADPNLESTLNGVRPLWAAVNARWQPRTRYPQPQEMGLQNATYLDLAEVLLEAGADPDARLSMHPWYMVYSGCGNRNCGLVDTKGSTAFWRAAYATDVDAMRLLVAWGADPEIPTAAPPTRRRRTPDEFLREQAKERLRTDTTFASLGDSARASLMISVRAELPDSLQAVFPEEALAADPAGQRDEFLLAVAFADSLRALERDPSGLPPVPAGGPGVFAVHAVSGVGYGEGFAGNAHRHAPDGWMPALRYLVEELGADVNRRDHNGYNAVHHAAARGDNEMILYLLAGGADLMAVSRRGQTTVDMANGPVQRVSPHPVTVALLEALGAKNNHRCVTC